MRSRIASIVRYRYKGYKPKGHWFELQLWKLFLWLMMVIVTGLVSLSLLIIVSMMGVLNSSQWFWKNNAGSTGQRNSRNASIHGSCDTIIGMFKMVSRSVPSNKYSVDFRCFFMQSRSRSDCPNWKDTFDSSLPYNPVLTLYHRIPTFNDP